MTALVALIRLQMAWTLSQWGQGQGQIFLE
jgi:hypothetical protein